MNNSVQFVSTLLSKCLTGPLDKENEQYDYELDEVENWCKNPKPLKQTGLWCHAMKNRNQLQN